MAKQLQDEVGRVTSGMFALENHVAKIVEALQVVLEKHQEDTVMLISMFLTAVSCIIPRIINES